MEAPQSPLIVALTEAQVARITALSISQLRAWDKRGLFKPNHVFIDVSKPYSRIYSFRDVVGLRALAVLSQKHKVSVKSLDKAAEKLAMLGFNHWADTKIYVVKKEVYFQHPGTGVIEGLKSGQYAMLEVIEVIEDVKEKVATLKNRSEIQIGQIHRNRYVARNSWVLEGTRIPVATVQRFLNAGYSVEQILEEYPTLKREDILAVRAWEKRLDKVA
jgi:uncharacterized protein (DUF433 family)